MRWLHDVIDSYNRLIVGLLLGFQAVMHLFWLAIPAPYGELAIPWLMSKGFVMLDNLVEVRPPLKAYALSALYGLLPLEPTTIVKVLNVLLVLGLSLLVYGLAYRYSHKNKLAALSALVFWVWWEPVYGNHMVYFETLVALCILLALWVWNNSEGRIPRGRVFLAGLFMGMAVMFKQQALLAVGLFGLWILLVRDDPAGRWREVVWFGAGAAVVPGIVVGAIAAQGLFDSYLYWNWTFNLGRSVGDPLTGVFVYKIGLTHILAPVFWLLLLRKTGRERRMWLLVGAMWLAGAALLYPNFSEIHVMVLLPLLAIMSGLVAGHLSAPLASAGRPSLRWLTDAPLTNLTLGGAALAVLGMWVWAGGAPYVPHPLGLGAMPAYDEFEPVADKLLAMGTPDDTLFVVPMLDGNPQLYVMTGMLPPGYFGNLHTIFQDAPGFVDDLLARWAESPPDFIVYFPELRAADYHGVHQIMDFVQAHYEAVDHVEDVMFNGDAVIYRYQG